MPPKRILLSFLLLAVGPLLHSQGFKKKFALTLTPVILPLPRNPLSVQPGLHYSTAHWGLHAEVAAPVYYAQDAYTHMQYTRLSLEAKKYLRPSGAENYYVALQSSYAFRSLTDTNGGRFFVHDSNDWYDYSKAHIQSPVFTMAAKIGLETSLGGRFFLDFFCGAGGRFINTTYTNVDLIDETPVRDHRWLGHIGPISSYRYNKNVQRLHLTAGLRVGYILK